MPTINLELTWFEQGARKWLEEFELGFWTIEAVSDRFGRPMSSETKHACEEAMLLLHKHMHKIFDGGANTVNEPE